MGALQSGRGGDGHGEANNIPPHPWCEFVPGRVRARPIVGHRLDPGRRDRVVRQGRGPREDHPGGGRDRIPEALDRLIELYTATNKPDEAAKYRDLRAAYPPELAPPPREKK